MAELVKRLKKEEFFKLQNLWYKKLVKSGFKDAEKFNNYNVLSFYCNTFDTLSNKSKSSLINFDNIELNFVENYFLYNKFQAVQQLQETARMILDEEHFLYQYFNEKERELIQLFYDGVKYKEMAEILNKRYKKKKFMKETDKLTISYLQSILDKIFVKSYKILMKKGRKNEG